MSLVDEKAVQKAVKALIAGLGIPEEQLSRIEVNCGGTIKVFTRSRAYYTAAHVAPFRTTDHEFGSEDAN